MTPQKIAYFFGMFLGISFIILMGIGWLYLISAAVGQDIWKAHVFPLTGLSVLLGYLTFLVIATLIRVIRK